MQLGIDRLITATDLQRRLAGKRLALVAHPASMTQDMSHSIDALMDCGNLHITAAFGPQHGMRGDKQDNMIESDDYFDPLHKIPVFSLYGEVRRPTDEMMATFDVLLFDVQDIGCRIYTYVTTLLYLLEACAEQGKPIWILDRPNPAGRPIEGTILTDGWHSFVGAGRIPMRHGLTMGEMARWFVARHRIEADLHVIAMRHYRIDHPPGYGWPTGQLSWVNPSPNASSLNMARVFPGTVLIEGTNLSEGRGTTIPLEVAGAPDIDIYRILDKMHGLAPDWMRGAVIRPGYFQPTFHKHTGKLCQGFQVHTDSPAYEHTVFQPYRLICLFLKALRLIHPNYDLWRKPPYEYETDRLPIDLINGGPALREWVDDPQATIADMESHLKKDESYWAEDIKNILRY